MAKGSTTRTVNTKEGILTLDFDFVPSDPTANQRAAFVPHNCDTCEWKFMGADCYGKNESVRKISPCPKWEISHSAFIDGYHEYLKDLHRRNYE